MVGVGPGRGEDERRARRLHLAGDRLHLGLAEPVGVEYGGRGIPGKGTIREYVDARDRHRGVSHHTEAVLALCLGEVTVAPTEAPGWREACAGLPLSHMGRGPDEDPAFFEAAYAAGLAAR